MKPKCAVTRQKFSPSLMTDIKSGQCTRGFDSVKTRNTTTRSWSPIVPHMPEQHRRRTGRGTRKEHSGTRYARHAVPLEIGEKVGDRDWRLFEPVGDER